jgi:hypothetical protein
MNERQRGVAHVNVFWFVIALILFLGAAGFAYLKTTELGQEKIVREEAQRVRDANNLRAQEKDEHLLELTKYIGLVGDFRATNGKEVESRFTSPEKLKAALEDLKKAFAVSGASVAELVDPLKKALDAERELIKVANTERDTLKEQLTAEKAAATKTQTEKDQQIQKLNADVAEASANLTREMARMNESISSGRTALEKAQADARTVKEASDKLDAENKKEKSVLMARIEAQKNIQQMLNAPQEPDGEVISSLDTVGLAWINLGTRQQLRPGTVFRILEKTKGGLRDKGMGQVQKVEMDRSEMRVTGLVDPYRPVVKGDLVANELYGPKVKRNIVLMGRFSVPHTKEDVKKLLEELGNKVHDKVSPQVDLIILGRGEFGEGSVEQPIEETDEWKKAQNLNIEMIPITKVMDLLKR